MLLVAIDYKTNVYIIKSFFSADFAMKGKNVISKKKKYQKVLSSVFG